MTAPLFRIDRNWIQLRSYFSGVWTLSNPAAVREDALADMAGFVDGCDAEARKFGSRRPMEHMMQGALAPPHTYCASTYFALHPTIRAYVDAGMAANGMERILYTGTQKPTSGAQEDLETDPMTQLTPAEAGFLGTATEQFAKNAGVSQLALDASSDAPALVAAVQAAIKLPRPIIREAFPLLDLGPGDGAGGRRWGINQAEALKGPCFCVWNEGPGRYYDRYDYYRDWEVDPRLTEMHVCCICYSTPPTIDQMRDVVRRGFILGAGANMPEYVLDFVAEANALRPAIAFDAYPAGPDPNNTGEASTGPVPGVAGFAALVPLFSPLSVGYPPIVPVFVQEAAAGYHVTRQRTASGQLVTAPTKSDHDSFYWVSWPARRRAERDALEVWIRDVVKGTRFTWVLRPDGDNTSATVNVRFVEDPTLEWVQRGVHHVRKALVEEVR